MKRLGYFVVCAAFLAFVLAPAQAQAIKDNFHVTVVGGDVVPGQSGGSGYDNGAWYEYPSGWWNQWFYDGPYRVYPKVIHIEFDVTSMGNPFAVVVNWTLPGWEMEQHPPTLPAEDVYIGRSPPWVINATGHYEFDYVIPYCALWVSVDVANAGNFVLQNGVIVHDCTEPGAAPAWYDDPCTWCRFSGVPAQTPNCSYGNCGTVAQNSCTTTGYVTKTRDGEKVTVKAWNYFFKEYEKHVRIRVEGTGATGNPVNVVLKGNNNKPPRPIYPDSGVEMVGAPNVGNVGGNWWVEVEAYIIPQPHEDVLEVDVPGVDSDDDVAEVWVWSCCTGRTDIPTMSEWGLAVMALLILAAGTLVYRRVRVSAAA